MSAFPKVFGGHFRVIPTAILERVDRLLDEQFALVPEAAKDREYLKGQILDYVDEHGVIPEFTLEKRPAEDIAADEAALGNVSPQAASSLSTDTGENA